MALNPYDTPRGRLRSRVETTRRQFLLLVGAIGALGASVFGGIELLKFMFPAATLEAPALFKTSFTVDDLTGNNTLKINVFSDTGNRVTVVLDATGIYAVYLVCTQTYARAVPTGPGVKAADDAAPKPSAAEQNHLPTRTGWACPCHGSRY